MSLLAMGLHMPSLGELLCLAIGFGLIAGLVVLVVFVVSRSSGVGTRNPTAFPVQSLGPGRFKVSGVRKDTRQDVTWFCEADSPENAKVKAELEGIIVTGIERA